MAAERISASFAAVIALAVALFVVLHSGWLGEQFCGTANSTGPVSLSWSPLGAECTGGTDDPVDVRFNWLFFPALAVVVWPVLGLVLALVPVRRERAAATADP